MIKSMISKVFTTVNVYEMFNKPGKVYRITARGIFSSDSTNSGAGRMRIKMGNTTLASSPNVALTTGITNNPWEVSADVICFSEGVLGTVEAQGEYRRNTGAIGSNIGGMENTSSITVDTTTSQTLQLSLEMNVANTNNTFTMRQFIVEAVGP